jgi:hypothetical protein
LQLALDDLRLIKTKMAELPKIPAPRNFTLTPEMAQQAGQKRRSARLYTTYRLASLISSLLFVMIFLGDIFVVGRLAYAPLSSEWAAPAEQRSADEIQSVTAGAEAIPEAESSADADALAEAEREKAEDMPAEEKVESADEAGESMEESENLAMEAAPQEEAEEVLAEPQVSEKEGAQEQDSLGSMDDKSAAETPTLVGDVDFASPSQVEGTMVADDAISELEAPLTLAEQDDYFRADSDIPRADAAFLRPVVILEIFLILIALISGLLAVNLRRRDRV